MNKLLIIVERSKDFFDAYAQNCEGVYGAGETVSEAKKKKNVLEAIELLKANSTDVPEILKGEYEVTYSHRFDATTRGVRFTLGRKAATAPSSGMNEQSL
jgi:predicted RNase H-like HicB family nuclease